MAEIVEYNTEGGIPELESMLQILFTDEEVRTLVNIRRDFEYKMHKTEKNRDDCLKYIDLELKLLRLVRIRHKKKGLQKSKLANLEMSITNRINKGYTYGIRWFPEDLRMWLSYFKFCKIQKIYGATCRVLEQMLSNHGSSHAELYIYAAQWQLNDCNNINKAREFLLKGIHIHPDNKKILKFAFQIELMDAAKRRRECTANGIPIDPLNAMVTSQKAECIYESSIKRMKDVEFLNDLLNICAEYDFTSSLRSQIYTDIYENQTCERMWDIIAKRELITGDKPAKGKISKCVEMYLTAVTKLNTAIMWGFYLDTLLELIKDTSVLPNYKRKLLMSAFHKAAISEQLTEKYYLIWVSYLQGPDKHKKLVEVLQTAVKQLPQSVTIWETLIRTYLGKGEDKNAFRVFDQAVPALGKNSLSVWQLMIMYEQTKRTNRVEELYKKSMNQSEEITSVLKPNYLEYLTLTYGIMAARKVYNELVFSPPPCLQMHKKMIFLESVQPILSLRKMRCAFTHACTDFGKTDISVWMDICKFEIQSGDPERVSAIFDQARQDLFPELVDKFLAEFSLIWNMNAPK